MADIESSRRIAYSPAPFSTWLGVVCLFLLFGIIVLAVIGPSPRGTDYEETRAKKRMEQLKTLREENQKELTTYAWVDKNKGVARIPIDRAMEVTVADLAQKRPAPAGPIATPPAQTAPAGASPAPTGAQQPGTARPAQSRAPAGSPAGQGPASPPPATQQSPASPASPAPATTP
jgi:hypothetical protein